MTVLYREDGRDCLYYSSSAQLDVLLQCLRANGELKLVAAIEVRIHHLSGAWLILSCLDHIETTP